MPIWRRTSPLLPPEESIMLPIQTKASTISTCPSATFQQQLSTTDASHRQGFRSTVGIHQKRSVASRFAWTIDYQVWGEMLKAYHKLHPKPKSITELEVVQVIWDSLSQEPFNKAVKSFTLWLKTCMHKSWWWTIWEHKVTIKHQCSLCCFSDSVLLCVRIFVGHPLVRCVGVSVLIG